MTWQNFFVVFWHSGRPPLNRVRQVSELAGALMPITAESRYAEKGKGRRSGWRERAKEREKERVVLYGLCGCFELGRQFGAAQLGGWHVIMIQHLGLSSRSALMACACLCGLSCAACSVARGHLSSLRFVVAALIARFLAMSTTAAFVQRVVQSPVGPCRPLASSLSLIACK